MTTEQLNDRGNVWTGEGFGKLTHALQTQEAFLWFFGNRVPPFWFKFRATR